MAALFAIASAALCLCVAFDHIGAAIVLAGFAALLYPFLKV